MTRVAATTIAILVGAANVTMGGSAARAADFLEDPRTARALSLTSPRASLGESLGALSRAAGIPLAAAAALEAQALTGHVPRRPLRETMHALEELYDATWVRAPASAGAAGGYRLEPDPAAARRAAAARAAFLRSCRKVLDDRAAEAVRRVRAGEPIPSGNTQQRDVFSALLWAELPAAERERVLLGVPVTIQIPEARSQPIYRLAILLASKEPGNQVGPLLASFDLTDRADNGLPWLRVRCTGMRADSIVGAITTVDFLALLPKPKAAAPPAAGAPLPGTVGENGRLSGSRDELLVRLARDAGLPILSRHRVYGGTAALTAGGRGVGHVMADLAAACDAEITVTARGFQLLRSRTEALDAAGHPPAAVRLAYGKARPAPGRAVSLDVLSELGALTPLQLSAWQLASPAQPDLQAAREIQVLLRFYRSLSPAHRQALSRAEGLEAAKLSHLQLHTLLDDKSARADWEVHAPLQEIGGLRFRILERDVDGRPSLLLDCLREGERVQDSVIVNLPMVEADEQAPTAGQR